MHVTVHLERPTREPVRAARRGSDRDRLFPYLVLLRVGFTLPPMLPPTRYALNAPFHPYRPATSEFRRYVFCGTFRRLAPPRHYLAPCPAEPGLSSPATRPRERLPGRLPIWSLLQQSWIIRHWLGVTFRGR